MTLRIAASVRRLDYVLDVHGFVHHNANLIEMANKMQLYRKIYYPIVP